MPTAFARLDAVPALDASFALFSDSGLRAEAQPRYFEPGRRGEWVGSAAVAIVCASSEATHP